MRAGIASMRTMGAPERATGEARVAADLMLRDPKTLPGGASVAEVRAQLANPKVQMVLLAERGRLLGAVTALPADAGADEAALDDAETDPETTSPDTPAAAAFDQAAASRHRRVIVVDDDARLLGLLCLDPTVRVSARPPRRPAAEDRPWASYAAASGTGGSRRRMGESLTIEVVVSR